MSRASARGRSSSSALTAFALGTLTLVLYLSGAKVSGVKPAVSVVIVYTRLMFGCSAGTWRMRYWAVLGFQTLLAIGILGFSLAAIRVTSVGGLCVCLLAIAFAGVLFCKLVRVLGRLQVSGRLEDGRRGGCDPRRVLDSLRAWPRAHMTAS